MEAERLDRRQYNLHDDLMPTTQSIDPVLLKSQLDVCVDLSDSNSLRSQYEALASERGEKVDWNTVPFQLTFQEFYDVRRKISAQLVAALKVA